MNRSPPEGHEQGNDMQRPLVGFFSPTLSASSTGPGRRFLNRHRFRKEFHNSAKHHQIRSNHYKYLLDNFINIMGISNYEYALNQNAGDGISHMTLSLPRKSDTQRQPFSDNDLNFLRGVGGQTASDSRQNIDLPGQTTGRHPDE